MFELVCDYIFNKEELFKNEYFNDNDKKLILKCCNMLDYLYFLEARKDLEPSEGIFALKYVKYQIAELAKKIKNSWLKNYLDKRKREKQTLTRISFEFFQDIVGLKNELSNNNYLLDKQSCEYFELINLFTDKNKKLKND